MHRPHPATLSFVRWMWFFIYPRRWHIIAGTIVSATKACLWSLIPFWITRIIQSLQGDAATQAGVYLAVIIGSFLFTGFLWVVHLRFGVTRDLLKRELSVYALDYILRLPLAWHETIGRGNMIQRIITARNAFADSILMAWEQVVPMIGTLIAIGISLTLLGEPTFMILMLGYAALYISIAWLIMRRMPQLIDHIEQAFERLIGCSYEFAANISTVKQLYLTDTVRRRAWQAEQAQARRVYPLLRLIFYRWAGMEVVHGLVLYGGIVGYGLWQTWHGQLAPEIFVALAWLVTRLQDALKNFDATQQNFFEKYGGFLRLVETLRQPLGLLDIPPTKPFPAKWRELRIQQVTHRYGHEDQPAIRDISFVIPRGQTVALVGHSGAGKSTITKLLTKAMLPSSGSITFDATPIGHITSKELVKHIAIVPQDVELFDLSIRENVLIRARQPRRLRRYLQLAHADNFIRALPCGADTRVGERGVKLSGGQKQRIGIARALAQEAEIIIFDEATSSLDSESEQAIQAAMHDAFAGKTAIIIAHRLATVRHADRILVFDRGRIVEDGTFTSLVKKRGGHFARLWKLQKLD